MDIALCYESVIPAKGGAETYIGDLSRRLARDGHAVHLYATRWDAVARPAVPPAVAVRRGVRAGTRRGAARRQRRVRQDVGPGRALPPGRVARRVRAPQPAEVRGPLGTVGRGHGQVAGPRRVVVLPAG